MLQNAAHHQPPKPTTRKKMSPHSIPKNHSLRSCLNPDFSLGAEQPNQTNPKFPAPAVHADRSLHSTTTKTCFFEPSTTIRLRPPAEDPEPIMKSAAPRCVWLLACPVLWNLFHPLGKLLRDRGRRGAWREAGTECVVPSSGPPNHLCSRLLGEMWPAGLPLVAPRPPLREWEGWRGQ